MRIYLKYSLINLFLFIFLSNANAQSITTKVKEYYNSGTIKIKGKLKNNLKTGSWYYYNEQGEIIKREKYDRKGKLAFTFIYNKQHKISEIIDKNGRITKRNSCGC